MLNVVVRFIAFLTSATLIFRGTDTSMCFRESLGIRDNESRLNWKSRNVSLCDFDITRENGNDFQTLENMIRRMLRRLIRICTFC